MGANFSQIKTWIDGDILTASDQNAEFQNILTNLTPAGIDDESSTIAEMRATKDPYAASTAVLPTSLQEEIQELRYMISQITGKTYWYEDAEASLTPTGAMLIWTTNTAPSGFLLCYGQEINRTTYSVLFGVIGTTFGVGDNSTTFNVPDMRGRFPLGQDDMGGSSANTVTAAAADTVGSTGGTEKKDISHVHTMAHTHTVNLGQNINVAGGTDAGGLAMPAAVVSEGSSSTNTGSAGSATQDFMNPYLTLNYIIKI